MGSVASLMEMGMIMKTRNIRSLTSIAVTTVALLAVGGLGGTASAATAGPASQPHPAPYPAAGAVVVAPDLAPVTSNGIVPATACTPYVDGDYAHLSSGDVSAHGWWYQGTCANTKTTVTIGLQEYFSDGTWHNQGTVGQANVYPGGGSANRAVARQVCEGVALAGWRSYVIVNIGLGASAYTNAQNLNCTHW
jgi:hypothetical protein